MQIVKQVFEGFEEFKVFRFRDFSLFKFNTKSSYALSMSPLHVVSDS